MSLTTIRRLTASVLPLALLCACAATRPLDPAWLATLSAQPPTALLLLGEQHDAPEHQQWEQATVQWLAQRGQLAALVIEMAEAGASTEGLPPTASEAEVRGALRWPDEAWPWADYGPVVMAAVRAGAPVLGGNLPRARLASARSNGALEARLPPEALARQQADVREGHCGLLPEGQVPAMARIQLARDQSLAETALQALRPGRTVVLAAGHQHVQRSLGVPAWLPYGLDARLQHLKHGIKVAIAQAGQARTAIEKEADYIQKTPALPARDYCAELRAQWSSVPAPAATPASAPAAAAAP